MILAAALHCLNTYTPTVIDRAVVYLLTGLYEYLSAQQRSNTFIIVLKVKVGIL